MSFAGMLVHDVTILVAGGLTDRYGDTIKDWNNATSTATKAWVYQRRSEEDHSQGRDAHMQEWRAFVPGDVAVSAGDRLYWPAHNLTFEVDGPPRLSYRPANLSAELHHLEVDLRHVAG